MRAIICGAGVAGLTLAWWLRQSNWDVVLIDHADGPRDGGYMLDFAGAGYDVLARMGLLGKLRAVDLHIPETHYVDRCGHTTGRLTHRTVDAIHRGRTATIMRGDLERILRDALHGLVRVRFGLTITTVRQTAADIRVALSDGREERADLLVGADGMHSRIRRIVFGPETELLKPLGYDAAAYTFKADSIDQEVDGRLKILTVPGRHVGVLPLGEGALTTYLLHRSEYPHLPRDPAARLREVYQGIGWVLDEMLTHCPEQPFYDRLSSVELDHWSRGRVALVGDAGLTVSPLAGQGASLAMSSAFALTTALYKEPDLLAALRLYEEGLMPVVRHKQAACRRLAKWGVPSKQWRITARNGALAAGQLPGMSWLLRSILPGLATSAAPPT